MLSGSVSEAFVCLCGRTFIDSGPLAFHKRSCAKTKKRLSDALSKAREVWVAKKKVCIRNTSGGSPHSEPFSPGSTSMDMAMGGGSSTLDVRLENVRPLSKRSVTVSKLNETVIQEHIGTNGAELSQSGQPDASKVLSNMHTEVSALALDLDITISSIRMTP